MFWDEINELKSNTVKTKTKFKSVKEVMPDESYYFKKPSKPLVRFNKTLKYSVDDFFKKDIFKYGMLFYDFEVFRHDWLVVIINPIVGYKRIICNDREALIDFYEQHKNEFWCGYNSREYDRYIYKTILLGGNPKLTNDLIIIGKYKGWQINPEFNKIQFYDFDIKTTYHGLKQLEGFLGDDIRESDVSFRINRELTNSEIMETIYYCTHDVEETLKVFKLRVDYYKSNLFLINKFNLPIKNISKSQAQLASVILKANNHNIVDDEWDIRLPDNLILNKYKNVANWFLNEKNHAYKIDGKSVYYQTNVAGIDLKFGWGGVHGAKLEYNYTCKENEIFLMVDVSQLYPNLMYHYKLLPRTVGDYGYKILKSTIDISIELKNKGLKEERKPYKDFNNICYGSMGDKYNSMYDPLHRNLVCVFGQILMLDLIEKIEDICELIQANTDGILVKIDLDKVDKLNKQISLWEKRTHLDMTHDKFTKIYQPDVNTYLVVGDKIKCIGDYLKERSALDNELPIVRDAIYNYLLKNIPVDETINNCNELIKFQQIVKLSNDFKFIYHNNKNLTHTTYRVFASKNSKDTIIGRYREIGDNPEKFSDTPEHCFIMNQSIKNLPVVDNLDKSWYIDLANQRLLKKFKIQNNNSFF